MALGFLVEVLVSKISEHFRHISDNYKCGFYVNLWVEKYLICPS